VCDLETSRIGAPYIYDISSLMVNDLTLILLKWGKWWANNASKWQMGFNSGFKGLNLWCESASDFYRITILKGYKTFTPQIWRWMITFLIDIETTRYSVSGAQLYGDTSRALTNHRQPPANMYRFIVGKLPTGAQLKSDVGGYCCRCLVTWLLPRGKALAMQHTKDILRNIISSLVCRVYRIPSYYPINRMIFGKKLLNIKCVFWFLYDLETFFIVRRLQRDISIHVRVKCTIFPYMCVWSARYSCHILNKRKFSRRISEEYSNIKFYGKPSSGSRVRTDGRTDMTKLIVAFRNFVKATISKYR